MVVDVSCGGSMKSLASGVMQELAQLSTAIRKESESMLNDRDSASWADRAVVVSEHEWWELVVSPLLVCRL